MKKTLMVVFILGAGGISLTTLNRTAEKQEAARPIREAELRTATNRLVELTVAITATRNAIIEKKRQLRQMQSGNQVDRELLALLEGRELSPKRWAQLREELGIGWNCSEDYVLVSKRVLKQIGLQPFDGNGNVTPVARAALAITPEEQSQIQLALKSSDDDYPAWVRTHAQRTEPAGDVVAQYTIPANPELALSLSNRIATAVVATLGNERADLFLPNARSWWGWQRIGVDESDATLTVRRIAINGESRLVWEWKHGSSAPSAEVAYGYYPSSSFLWLFPGGWADLARREGFELPASFPKPRAP